MKLTDDVLDELFKEKEVVRLRSGTITLGLTRDCLEEVLNVLGDKARTTEWELME